MSFTVGMTRPPIGRPVQIRLPDDLLAEIDERCEQQDSTRAAFIRELLRKAIR